MRHNDNDEQIESRERIEQEAAASERTLASMTRHILKSWAADRQASKAA